MKGIHQAAPGAEESVSGFGKKPLIIIAGPTAVGKTAVSVQLAKMIGGEIVSADSVQVYRGLDIGSAKVTAEEMEGVPHHLIDVMQPEERYDVARFQQMAAQAVQEIQERGHIPILCGGTGFYIQALLYDISFSEEEAGQSEIRQALEKEAALEGGAARLYERLRQCDPVSCEIIHQNNHKRVIRALEYFMLHGTPISKHNAKEREKLPCYDASFFVLTDERERLYQRIDQRVEQMFSQGLVKEVQGLKDRGLTLQNTAMQGIGYKETAAYLDGSCTLEEAKELIKKNSRNYAKRQLTWFRREKQVIWVDISKFNYDKEEIAQWLMKQSMNR